VNGDEEEECPEKHECVVTAGFLLVVENMESMVTVNAWGINDACV
jgi:hypothetical protein